MNRGSNRTRRALISVSDKTGVVPFAQGLAERSFEIISTGGTARLLREAGVPVREVSEVTGFPEIMDGRVKTLHPAVHGGLLARSGIDEAVTAEQGIGWIDLLVVNLYPFESTVRQPGCTVEQAIENIDIGGPAMLRAAAKNHARVTVVVDPGDYPRVLEALDEGEPREPLRRELGVKAFGHTCAYDGAISGYLQGVYSPEKLPDPLILTGTRAAELRYGENPHQRAAVYLAPGAAGSGVADARQLQGKPLSFNNLADTDAALRCAGEIDACACIIVKHANPCGAAVADTCLAAYDMAYRTDPTSAFGGIVVFNRPLDGETAAAIVERQLVDVVAAPRIAEEALSALGRKKLVRVLEVPRGAGVANWDVRSIEGGFLLQEGDRGRLEDVELKPVTRRAPSAEELRDLGFAWTIAKYVKSNAIVFVRGGATLGVGAGQMSRVVSARVAALKAADEGLDLAGAAMASDAFFPFRDGIDIGAEQGISSVIQPGGSVRDEEVIQAANEHDIAMVFTGMRHFRH